jgi:hypothetical protein
VRWRNPRLKPAAHLFWAEAGDVVFLMDGRCGEYFGLDPRASRLWLRLANAEGAIDEPTDAELTDLIESASARGWLVASREGKPDCIAAKPRAATAFQPFPAVDAYACLLRSFFSLRHLGFWRAYAWARRAATRASATASAGGASRLEHAIASFARAERAVVSRLGFEDCLPRSLALYVFLNRAGIPVRHRIGVRRYPFLAHAWVEHADVPLLSRQGSTLDFVPIATLGD